MRCKKSVVLLFGSLIIFLLSSSLSYADWSNVTPPTVTGSTDWELWGVSFTSSGDGWAVGKDDTNGTGVLLHYSGGTWSNVTPPTVTGSTYWYLNGVSFTSSGDGWAVGYDYTNSTGVLLHYSGGTWSNVTPPTVSSYWGLNGVSFTSSGDGWAVGYDYTNTTGYTGVLLHYSGGTWSNVTPPTGVSSPWGLNGVSFTSSGDGWAVGEHIESIDPGVLLHYSAPVSSSVSVPTMNGWGIIIFILLAGLGSAYYLRKKRTN